MESIFAEKRPSTIFLFALLMTLSGCLAWGTECTAGTERPISLKECIDIALQRNWGLIQSRLRLEEALYNAKASKKEMFPRLQTDYSLLWRRDESEITIFGRKTVISPHETYNWKAYVTQPLFLGGRLWNTFKAAKIEVDISNLMLTQQANELVRQVKNLYFDLVKAQKLLEEAEAAHKRLKAHLADAKGFYEAGLRTRNDLLESKVELAKGEEDLIKALHDVDIAKARLNLVMQRPLSQDLIPSDQLRFTPFKHDLDNLYVMAEAQRPELMAGRLAVKKAERLKKAAKARLWPQLQLTGTYERTGDTPFMRKNPFGDTEQVTLLVKASWELWNWGQTFDEIKAADVRLKLAKSAYNDLKEQVCFEVKEAFLRLKEAEKAIKVTESALEHAEENFRLYNERYRQQLTTSTDVLDAQTLLTQAKSRYVISVAHYAKAEANLEYAIGNDNKISVNFRFNKTDN